jgi:hypothetical protein
MEGAINTKILTLKLAKLCKEEQKLGVGGQKNKNERDNNICAFAIIWILSVPQMSIYQRVSS